MSQLNPQQEVNIPAAFRNPPRMAEQFRQSFEQSAAAQETPVQPETQQPPQPQVQPQQVVVPPQRVINPVLPSQTAKAPEPPLVNANQQATEPAGGDRPVSPPPAPNDDSATLRRQLEWERQLWANERQQMQQNMEAYNQQLQQAAQIQQEYNQLKQQEALQQQLSDDKLFENLTTVDADDARQLVGVVARTLQAPLDSMRNTLQEQQKVLAQQQQYLDGQLYRMSRQQAAEKLQAAHPDFAQVVNDPAFVQFAQQREGHTSKTRERVAFEEFNAGNPDYVINLVNDFKGITPQADAVKTVPPVQVANSVVQPAPAQTAPQLTLSELNTLMQMRRITPDEYRAYLADMRKAQEPAQML